MSVFLAALHEDDALLLKAAVVDKARKYGVNDEDDDDDVGVDVHMD